MSVLDMHMSNIQQHTEFDLKEMGTGDIVKFLYGGADRYAFVLNEDDGKGLMHCLTLEKTSPQLLYKFKMVLGANIDEDPQTVYRMYIARDKSLQAADCYRTFNRGKVGKIEVLDYRFGYGGRDRLIPYGSTRDFTEEEYVRVAYSYFQSPSTVSKFPKMANTVKELVATLKEAQIEQLDITYLRRLENSSAPMVLAAPDPLRTAMNWGKRRGETLFGIRDIRVAVSNGSPIPPAIVISYDPDNRFLFDGDIRLCIALAKGFSLGIKIINYEAVSRETSEKKREKEPIE